MSCKKNFLIKEIYWCPGVWGPSFVNSIDVTKIVTNPTNPHNVVGFGFFIYPYLNTMSGIPWNRGIAHTAKNALWQTAQTYLLPNPLLIPPEFFIESSKALGQKILINFILACKIFT